MKRQDKIAIIYAIILCILFIIHINTDKLEKYEVFIPILLLLMIWDLFFRPRKYEITFSYLSKCYLNDAVEIYCTYDNNHIVKNVYCRVINDDILDGYRKLNSIIGFPETMTLQSFKNIAKNITNVEELTNYMAKNYNISYTAKKYEYYKSDANLLTWASFAFIVVISIIYYFIGAYGTFNSIDYYVF